MHLVRQARDRSVFRRARARLVTRVEPGRAGDGQVREAVARRIVAVPVRPTVALRAAEPTADPSAREAAEPLARRDASVRAAAALLARLARVITGDLLAEHSR